MRAAKAKTLRKAFGYKRRELEPLKLERVGVQKYHQLKRHYYTELIMLTARYPESHTRRLYQNSKLGQKGKPLASIPQGA